MTPHHEPQATRSDPGNPNTATAPSSSPPRPGHDARGRFAKGNPGGPGNPFARKVAAFRQKFLEAVSDDDLAGIARSLIDQARQGDVAAARLVLQYALGKPAPVVDPDGLEDPNASPWDREFTDGRDLLDVLRSIAASLPPGTVPGVPPQEPAAESVVRKANAPEEDDKQERESHGKMLEPKTACPAQRERQVDSPAPAASPALPTVEPGQSALHVLAECDPYQPASIPRQTELPEARHSPGATVSKRRQTDGRDESG